jgi:hypothetical protein
MSETLYTTIGEQTLPPFRRVFQIAVQGIRIRIGRSLVTLSGVVLGTAFLMSTVSTQFVDRAVARERDAQRQLATMENLLRAQVGALSGKILSVAVFGELSRLEMDLIARLREANPAALRLYGSAQVTGLQVTVLPDFGRDSAAVLLLGNADKCPVALASLTEGMTTRLVLDSRAGRQCQTQPGIRVEPFFGPQLEDQQIRQARKAADERFRAIWIVIISLAVTIIGVANALLMSVTERFREIGTMKCLGALSSFIRRLFLIESFLIGLAGSTIGVVAGSLLTLMVYGAIYGFGMVFGTIAYAGLFGAALTSIIVGTILSVAAALYPARFASRMVPASALRSTV